MLFDLLDTPLRQPAECIVKVGVGRTEIASLYPFLSELTVDCARDKATVATLVFETRRDETGRWTVQDSGILAPWQPILIEAAFGSTLEEVMRGYILPPEADYPGEPGATRVTVYCQDDSVALGREHVRKTWGDEVPTSDGVILATILGSYPGLVLHPDSKPGLSGVVANQDETDIQFLRRRAEANGYELIFRDGKVYFGPVRFDAKPQANIKVYAGLDTNCLSLSINGDSHWPDQVAYDVASRTDAQTLSESVPPDLPSLGTQRAESGDAGLKPFVWRMSREGSVDPAELKARAQAAANEQSLKVRATGELDGSLYGHVLRVGEPVGVDGAGEWLDGIYYVDTVTHRFNVTGYRESFALRRNAYGNNLPSGGRGNLLSSVL